MCIFIFPIDKCDFLYNFNRMLKIFFFGMKIRGSHISLSPEFLPKHTPEYLPKIYSLPNNYVFNMSLYDK